MLDDYLRMDEHNRSATSGRSGTTTIMWSSWTAMREIELRLVANLRAVEPAELS